MCVCGRFSLLRGHILRSCILAQLGVVPTYVCTRLGLKKKEAQKVWGKLCEQWWSFRPFRINGMLILSKNSSFWFCVGCVYRVVPGNRTYLYIYISPFTGNG